MPRLDSDRHLYDVLTSSSSYLAGDIGKYFSEFKSESGNSSYELFSQQIDSDDEVVLDLGCGSKELCQAVLAHAPHVRRVIGCDFEWCELQIDNEVSKPQELLLCCAAAQALPLQAASIDVVLAHLSLMLFCPVRPVFEEVGRVLTPGGKFIFNLLAQPSTELGQELQDLSRHYEEKVIEFKGWGEEIAHSVHDFSSQLDMLIAFEQFKHQHYEVTYRSSPQTVVRALLPFYQVSMLLPDVQHDHYLNELEQIVVRYTEPKGEVSCTLDFELCSLRKKY